MYMSVICVQGTVEAEGGFRPLGAGVTGGCELPKVGDGNKTQLSGRTNSELS